MRNAQAVVVMVAAIGLLGAVELYGDDQADVATLKPVQQMEQLLRTIAAHGGEATDEETALMAQYAAQLPKDPKRLAEVGKYLAGVMDSTRKPGVVPIEDVARIYQFRRAALTSMDIEYTIDTMIDPKCGIPFYADAKPLVKQSVRLVRDNAKLFRESIEQSASGPGAELGEKQLVKLAYNGKDECALFNNQGNIHEGVDLRQYFASDYVPAVAGLLGDSRGHEAAAYYQDMVKVLTEVKGAAYVLPQYESLNGVQAVVVKYGTDATIWLDPARDFAPLKVQVMPSGNSDKVVDVIVYSDHADRETGFCLPRRVISERKIVSPNGESRLAYRQELVVKKMVLNGKVDDSLFTPQAVFPVGTPIHDARSGVDYFYGSPDPRDLNKTIDRMVTSGVKAAGNQGPSLPVGASGTAISRVWITLCIGGVVLVLMVVGIAALRRRRLKPLPHR